jgi:hypothetical protein
MLSLDVKPNLPAHVLKEHEHKTPDFNPGYAGSNQQSHPEGTQLTCRHPFKVNKGWKHFPVLRLKPQAVFPHPFRMIIIDKHCLFYYTIGEIHD